MLKDFIRVDRVSVRKFNEEYYLLGGKRNYKINEIGVIIFKYIGSDIKIEELRNKIMEKYEGGTREQIDSEINNFINLLLKEGLIERSWVWNNIHL